MKSIWGEELCGIDLNIIKYFKQQVISNPCVPSEVINVTLCILHAVMLE